MEDHGISRRQLAKFGLGMAAMAGFTSLPCIHTVPAARAEDSRFDGESGFEDALDNAYSFLNAMMDAYAQDSTVRLSQSYTDQQGLQSTGFVYDNSLVINAHLLRGQPEDLSRAIVLGKALLHSSSECFSFHSWHTHPSAKNRSPCAFRSPPR